MDYFKTLCLVLGVMSVMASCIYLLNPAWLSDWVLNKIYTEKKSLLMDFFCGAWLLLVIYTWYRFFRELHPYTFVICLVISLALVKIFLIEFRYVQFRTLVVALMTQEKIALRILALSSLAIGVGLLMLGMLL